MLTLKFLPEIEGDILDAVAWYDSRSVQVGDNCLNDFYTVTDDLAHFPKRRRKVRSFLTNRTNASHPAAN